MDASVKSKISQAEPWLSRGVFGFFAAVVGVQAVHVFEHIVQLAQVYVFGVPDDDALGLLGYVFQFNGTEEWLHLVFNVTYLAGFLLLLRPIWRARSHLPRWALWTFLAAGVGVQIWHAVEHVVIIRGVIANSGCPCPGILDVALGTSDTVLHFFYNTITFLGLLAPFRYVARGRLVLPRSALFLGKGRVTRPIISSTDGPSRPVRRVDAGNGRVGVVVEVPPDTAVDAKDGRGPEHQVDAAEAVRVG